MEISKISPSVSNYPKTKKSLKRKSNGHCVALDLNGTSSSVSFTKITPTKSEYKQEIQPISKQPKEKEPIITNGKGPKVDSPVYNGKEIDFDEEEFYLSSTDEENEPSLHDSVLDEFIDENCTHIQAEIVSPYIKLLQDLKKKRKKQKRLQSQLKIILPTPKPIEPPVEETICEEVDEPAEDEHVFQPPQAQFCYTDEGIVAILEYDETLYFYGFMEITVLHGVVEVFGYEMDKNSKPLKVYSPRSTSKLYIKNETQTDEIPISHYLQKNPVLRNVNFSIKCAIILCRKIPDDILFIEKHVPQILFPKFDQSSLPRVDFQVDQSRNITRISPDWYDLLSREVGIYTKLFVCGGKGVGKSTFLRFAINRLLLQFNAVKIIDLDPGQPEFTVPGCISILKIKEPVVGATYTHLKEAEKSILCNINVQHEPEKYIQCVKKLIEDDKNEQIPTLVNYMGYTHGLGINILSSVIAIIRPTDVVQLFSRENKKNYKVDLKPSVVKNGLNLFEMDQVEDLNYYFYKYESMVEKQSDGWNVQSRQSREMAVLAYFNKIVTKDNSLFSKEIPLFRVGLEDVVICDLSGNCVDSAAVNANFVALCVETEPDIFRCYGWGIVRGIDLVSNDLVLITAENEETLEKVTHLVLGSVTLPPSLYMTPDELLGSMPYVMEGKLTDFGELTKRSMNSARPPQK